MGRAKLNSVSSSAQVYVFLIPLMILLPLNFGSMGIWFAFSVTDGVLLIICISLIAAERKKLLGSTANKMALDPELAS